MSFAEQLRAAKLKKATTTVTTIDGKKVENVIKKNDTQTWFTVYSLWKEKMVRVRRLANDPMGSVSIQHPTR